MNDRFAKASATAALMTAVFAVAGCGTRPGQGGDVPAERGATLVVTRDYGRLRLAGPRVAKPESGLTALRQLQAAATTETAYGGRFVTAINGLKQNVRTGHDWLFYVDGEEAQVGAAAMRPRAGQVVQWDYHPWRDVRVGGAIVGAFPLPLRARGASVDCLPMRTAACAAVRAALTDAGVRVSSPSVDDGRRTDRGRASERPVAGPPVRVVVGTADRIAGRDGARDLYGSAAGNGLFARFARADGALRIELVDQHGTTARTEPVVGLVAARREGASITWIVTGVDERGVLVAARTLSRRNLRDRFAVAVGAGGEVVPLPVAAAGAKGVR